MSRGRCCIGVRRGLCRVGTSGLSPAAAARLGRDRTAANLDVALIMAQLHRLEQAGVDVSGDGVDSDG